MLRSNQPGGSSLLVEKRRTVTPAPPFIGPYPEIEREVVLEFEVHGEEEEVL